MRKQSDVPSGVVMEDMTGMDRLAKNVFASWAGYLVVMLAGFIMPRMIDNQIGQEALGIWDFCWSIVSYFGFAGLGVGTSVNRYVARYRTVGDLEAMNRALSSVYYVQMIIALAMFIITGLIFWSLPIFFSSRLGQGVGTAAYVLAFLGASLATQMAFDVFRGVITGCHRWDIHNLINSSSHVLTAVGMLTVLVLGGGLTGMSMVYFLGTLVTEVVRFMAAKSICPGLKIKLALANRTQALEMITFGGKSFLTEISPMLLLQTTNILIAAHLGPATLALFARPSSLVRHAQTFLNKFAFVLTPTAGSLQGHGRQDELRSLFLQSTKFSVAITLPMVIVLTVFGDEILRVWMGHRYEQGVLLSILAIGYFLPISQQSAFTIMAGLNQHGRMGLVIFGVALCGIGLSAGIAIFSTWTLTWAASIVAVCLTVGHGVAFPVVACRKLDIRLGHYLRNSFLVPFACSLPFIGFLIGAKYMFMNSHKLAGVAGLPMGMLILAMFYWNYILTDAMRLRIRKGIKLWKTAKGVA